ncbi:MAG TPA: hypothetical protein EYP22_04805 [Methanosarcinales archaeon]|nr:hypothetical protein [Methanosarcinales archaeon]
MNTTDATPPEIIYAVAVPNTIVANGTDETTFVVKATDPESNITSVTMDLTQIGGNASQALEYNATLGVYTYSTGTTEVGNFSLPVEVTNGAGLTNKTNIQLNTTAPPRGVSITTPIGKTTDEKVNATYELTVTNTGGVLDNYNLSVDNIDGASVAQLNTTTLSIGAGLSKNVTLNVTNDINGSFRVTVTVTSQTDPIVNATTGIITTTVLDITKPTIISAIAVPDTIVANGTDNTTFIVKAIDRSGILSVTMNLSAIGGNATQKLNYHAPIDIWYYITNTTRVGNFSLPVNVTDNAGNSNTSVSITLNATDATPPVINWVRLNKTKVNQSEHILVTVNATDNVGVVNVTADGIPLIQYTGDIWYGTIIAKQEPGLYNVTVIAYDDANNSAVNDTVQYEVIPKPPIIYIIYPIEGQKILIDGFGEIINVSAHAISESNITSVTFYYYNGTAWNIIGAANEPVTGDRKNGTWNVTWDATKIPAAPETNYSIKANASTDGVFNESLSINITVAVKGDCNRDSNVDFADVTYIGNAVMNIPGYEVNEKVADVNGDCVINFADVTYLGNHVIGTLGYEELKNCPYNIK